MSILPKKTSKKQLWMLVCTTKAYNTKAKSTVDGMLLLVGKRIEEIKEGKLLLNQEFDMKDLGTIQILGMKISRDRETRTKGLSYTYPNANQLELKGYSDSELCWDLDKRRLLAIYKSSFHSCRSFNNRSRVYCIIRSRLS